MSTITCREVVRALGAYLDDELTGAKRLTIAEHLEGCPSCATERDSLRELGVALRLESGYSRQTDEELGGLAGSVISRIGAERSQSWRAFWNLAFDDWHWAAVGFGSVAGAFISFVFASAMVYSSITHLAQMNASAGTLYLMALPEDARGGPVMVDGQGSPAPRQTMPASFGREAERLLVSALAETLIRSGQPSSLQGLPKVDRDDILALLSEISNLRYQPVLRPGGRTSVVGVHLYVNTSVTATIP